MWASDQFTCQCCTCREERVLRFKTHVSFFKIAVGCLNGIPLRMNMRTLNEAADGHIAVQRLSERRAKQEHV